MSFAATFLISITTWAKKLALDAPLVAVTWVAILRRGYSSQDETPPTVIAVMVFATVWLIYMFDRLMDARGLPSDRWTGQTGITDRHRFAKANAKILWPLWFFIGAVTVLAAFTWMDAGLRRNGIIHLGMVSFYFLFVHGRFSSIVQAPKEMVVGVLFALGVSMTVAPPWSMTLAIGVTLLASLFSLNCLIVSHSENASPRWGRQQLFLFGILISLASALLMLVSDLPRLLCVCACASACLSSFLCYWPGPIDLIRDEESAAQRTWNTSGILADAVLVGAPLAVVAFWPVLGHE